MFRMNKKHFVMFDHFNLIWSIYVEIFINLWVQFILLEFLFILFFENVKKVIKLVCYCFMFFFFEAKLKAIENKREIKKVSEESEYMLLEKRFLCIFVIF